MTQLQETIFDLPNFTNENLKQARLVSMAHRKGGINLSHQLIKNKHIFHNYGYGNASVLMSFGASHIISKSITRYTNYRENQGNCAVLGCGPSGLFTALELLRNGRKVTLYAQQFPTLKSESDKKKVPSQLLPLSWIPSNYDYSADMLKHELISKLSYEYLQQSVILNRYLSVKYVKMFNRSDSIQDLKQIITEYVYNKFQENEIQYPNGSKEKLVVFDGFHIDSNLFLEELRIEAVLRGATFVEKRFNSIDDVTSLAQNHIFNCTGESSKYLFNDNSFETQSNLVLEFQIPQISKLSYVLKSRGKDQLQFEIQRVGKKTFVVTPYEQKELKTDTVNKKIQKLREFVDAHKLKPKL